MQASLRRAKQAMVDGTPVLFKGHHFGKSSERGGYPTDPKWHLLENVEAVRDSPTWFHWVWKARCGYKLKVDALSAHPDARHEVKTAKLRCAKCDAAAAKDKDNETRKDNL